MCVCACVRVNSLFSVGLRNQCLSVLLEYQSQNGDDLQARVARFGKSNMKQKNRTPS